MDARRVSIYPSMIDEPIMEEDGNEQDAEVEDVYGMLIACVVVQN